MQQAWVKVSFIHLFVITFQSVALLNHLDFMCISCLWALWCLFIREQVEDSLCETEQWGRPLIKPGWRDHWNHMMSFRRYWQRTAAFFISLSGCLSFLISLSTFLPVVSTLLVNIGRLLLGWNSENNAIYATPAKKAISPSGSLFFLSWV